MLTSSKLFKDYLSLIRLGIGTSVNESLGEVDWMAIKALADRQGLSAILLDGVERLKVGPRRDVLLTWIGEVLVNYEQRYALYRSNIAEMVRFYNSFGFGTMILKGYSCSLDWPKPEHRPCGDIDIWQFGKQREADASLEKERHIKIDSSHHHHTVFYWGDFMVENHYDFINVHHHNSNSKLEEVFKELGRDDSHYVEINGDRVYLPSPNLHALFLLRHSSAHFAAEGINLRQVLDWAFFVKAHGSEIDWPWLLELLKRFGMMPFYQCINGICVDDLGFDASIFPSVQYNPLLKERVLYDILAPEYGSLSRRSLIPRIMFKFRRWFGNSWKHRLCYNESMWSAFWSGVWNHLMKPSSI